METIISIFTILSTVLSLVLGSTWSSKSWLNILIKIILYLTAFLGGVILVTPFIK